MVGGHFDVRQRLVERRTHGHQVAQLDCRIDILKQRAMAALPHTLHLLLDPATRVEELMELRGGLRLCVPCFRVGEQRVWGATAMILSEFLQRLNYVKLIREHGLRVVD